MMTIRFSSLSLAALLAVLCAGTARAQFTGEIALPVPASSYGTDATVGTWTVSFSPGGTRSVSTSGSPEITAFTLSAFGSGMGSFGSASFSHTFTQAGVFEVRVSASLSAGGGGASATASWSKTGGGGATSLSSGVPQTLTLSVVAGDVVSFSASALGGSTFGFPVGMPTMGSSSLVVDQATFTASAVPEPAGAGLLAGLATLGAVGCGRRRRAV